MALVGWLLGFGKNSPGPIFGTGSAIIGTARGSDGRASRGILGGIWESITGLKYRDYDNGALSETWYKARAITSATDSPSANRQALRQANADLTGWNVWHDELSTQHASIPRTLENDKLVEQYKPAVTSMLKRNGVDVSKLKADDPRFLEHAKTFHGQFLKDADVEIERATAAHARATGILKEVVRDEGKAHAKYNLGAVQDELRACMSTRNDAAGNIHKLSNGEMLTGTAREGEGVLAALGRNKTPIGLGIGAVVAGGFLWREHEKRREAEARAAQAQGMGGRV